MNRLLLALVAVAILGGLAYVGVTGPQLPPVVATHFGRGGMADGWMPRSGYVGFALGLTLLLPLIVLAGTAWLPGRFPRGVNLPHRELWLAPAHRAATIGTLRRYGSIMALASALFAIALHAFVLAANARSPARLDEPAFLVLLGAYAAVMIGGAIGMTARFRRPPGTG